LAREVKQLSENPMFWFNIKTKQVEHGLKSSSLDRIGPFETEAEAKNAEATVKARSEEWKRQEAEEA
jgi:hypothetical protein